ncbi:MAG TPA: Do family serine endopeptidase [Steroidobacteraceae bacterium]|nr:Do family serine endopeptidase [Steroidobacteraceae bacterium]
MIKGAVVTRIAAALLAALAAPALWAATPAPASSPASAPAPASPAAPAQTIGPDDAPLPTLAPMIRRVAPAVVNVATRGSAVDSSASNPLLADPAFNRFFDVPQAARGGHSPQFQSAGSGVVLDARKGYVVTNAHVIENASEITVTLADGRDMKAEIVGIDEPTDIAVLKVRPVRLTQIALGDSTRLEVGDFVVAIGNPFGLRNSVTSGIVSGLGRSSLDQNGFEDFIQTDAAINPGNSGGALVNLRGEMVGLATAILARSGGNIGIGFAIPVDMIRSIADQLEQFGSVKRGLLGVDTYPVSPDIAQALGLSGAEGALVTQVLLGSPAEQAGIRSGDVIVSINNTTVVVPADVRNAIGLLRVGDTADIELLRNGRTRHVQAQITQPPEAPAAAPVQPAEINPAFEGAALAENGGGNGVVVRNVDSGSPAAAAGIRADDVIVAVNQSPVANLQQLRDRTAGLATLVLEVQRGKSTVLIPVR